MNDDLPLLELFTRLRQAGFPLGISEYQAVLQALQGGFGVGNRADLARLCCSLWVKSAEEEQIFNYHFEQLVGSLQSLLQTARHQLLSQMSLINLTYCHSGGYNN